jgi:uncharacterized membrane protein
MEQLITLTKINVLVPALIACFVACYIAKFMPGLAKTRMVYEVAPEYAELDKSIGTYNLPARAITVFALLFVFFCILVWKNIEAYREISGYIAQAPELKNYFMLATRASLLVQTGLITFAMSTFFKTLEEDKIFKVYFISGALLSLVGFVLMVIILAK